MSTQSGDEMLNDLSTLMFNNLGLGVPGQDEKWEAFLKLVESHNSLCRSYERLLSEVDSDDEDYDEDEDSSEPSSDSEDDTKEEEAAPSEAASKEVESKGEEEILVQPPV